MPAPPRKGEERAAFIGRCIPYLIKREGKTRDQAAGQCYGMWRNKSKKKSNPSYLSKAIESRGK